MLAKHRAHVGVLVSAGSGGAIDATLLLSIGTILANHREAWALAWLRLQSCKYVMTASCHFLALFADLLGSEAEHFPLNACLTMHVLFQVAEEGASQRTATRV